MQSLPSSRTYVVMAILFSVGRTLVAVILGFLLVTIVVEAATRPDCPVELLKSFKRSVHLSLWILFPCAIGAFTLGYRLKCPNCRENLVLMWSNNAPGYRRYINLSFPLKILYFFIHPGIITGITHCVNCDVAYKLKNKI